MHKAQLILDAIFTKLQALVVDDTIKQAFRNRAMTPDLYPCVCMRMGADTPQNESSKFIDSALTINTDIYLTSVDSDLNSQMLVVRAAIHKALFEDPSLGLAFVISATPLGQGEPEHDGESDRYVATTRLSWSFLYRTSYQNPEI